MRKQHARSWIAAVIVAALALIFVPALVEQARADLPPRPELPETPAAGDSLDGARIVLRAAFSADWPWYQIHGRDLWTVVEWQDRAGAWHVVEGWQGTLDEIALQGEGDIMGEKTWWVYRSDLGAGPFRWAVYEREDGRLIAVSESFDLPAGAGEQTVVGVELAP